MNELKRAELLALYHTTRTPGWSVVERVLDKLVQDRVDKALGSIENAGPLTHRAGGAREVITDFKKFVAGITPAQISETASD